MPKKGMEDITKKKMDYVTKLVKDKPETTLNQANKAVQKQFGSRLAYQKLRKAFVAGGGKVDERRGMKNKGKGKSRKPKGGKRGRKPSAITAKKVAYVQELVNKHAGMSMNEISKEITKKFKTVLAFPKLREAFLAAGGKIGTQGRRKKGGRRAADRQAARTSRALGGLSKHLVVVNEDNGVQTETFGTRRDAEAFARKSIEGGVPSNQIGYYTRESLSISVDL